MDALTFQEIRNIVHRICEDVDTEYSDDVDTYQAINELCKDYFWRSADAWMAAAGMRFNYHWAWMDAEERQDTTADLEIGERLYNCAHDCLVMLVEDAHSNGDHLPEEAA